MIDPPEAPSAADPLDEFTAHRRLLFGTAYRLLGSVADAEDVLQDAWIAWSAAGRAEQVANPRAYLVRTVTNLSLTRLTSARAVRESYVGPWLPEPVLTEPDAADEAELADTVSTALLVVLESLGPVERAVFVLREAFGFSHAEIAGFLDRTETSVRQTAHRARAHVQARHTRFDTDPEQRRAVTGRFLAACDGGDLNAMLELLAPDVTAWSDGGGKVTAARRPLHGTDPVARWMVGVLAKPGVQGISWRSALINGEEGVLFTADGHPIGALTFDLDGGLMRNLRFQVNPDKLRGLRR
ncbi:MULTISPECIES: RNA polymerase sigma factor SigJ [Kitasatospora]|uniref:Putative RNA polymerase ECF subfamily sigma factor n=1 Tax=Kitasatospora setae (strain ATCC 33774 / DSM 43861 / JCM 3304 / KCC A-0304 / NBRC 14216 / KM-6054) TaxID=452652 RepID=E4NJT5_KITSK|nr:MULTISPECIES: RNA polymerase sigma factor SigJ [Kitasatospora]BAJ33233.1 putative RNA polymerase ECF subfamily sigma factor [Kitasatospora setae KM-6054]